MFSMKSISTILSVICLALIGVLFYLHFTHQEKLNRVSVVAEQNAHNNFKIAYFDIDTLQAHYLFFKDALSQMKVKESAMNSELSSLESTYQRKIREWQQKGASMSQSEGEAAQKEYGQMQQNYQSRKMALEQQLLKDQQDLKASIKDKIEKFLKNYNKDRAYSYIFSYEPDVLIYYKDTAYNITSDLVKGLNDEYKNSKKK